MLANPLVQAELARQSRDIDELLGRNADIKELQETINEGAGSWDIPGEEFRDQ